jgi:hypothetical protein
MRLREGKQRQCGKRRGAEEEEDEHLRVSATHTRTEVRDSGVGLLAPTKVGGGDEDVTHREHTETTELLRRVEDLFEEEKGRKVSKGSTRRRSEGDAQRAGSAMAFYLLKGRKGRNISTRSKRHRSIGNVLSARKEKVEGQ